MKTRRRHYATALGENTIKRFHANLLALILAPLALAGCIMPVGVQVASLIADGVSLATTDKTLTDHGLSAVTEQDCAMWRVVNDEEVCRDYEQGLVMTADADQGGVKAPQGLPWRPVEAADPLIDADDMAMSAAGLQPIATPDRAAVVPAVAEKSIVPAPPAKTTQALELASVPARTTPAVETRGGMFFVIASFSRLNGAERFARRHAALATHVLAGTAKGKAVYRVAIGPVGKPRRRDVKAQLFDAGLANTWALTQKKPRVVLEVVTLN